MTVATRVWTGRTTRGLAKPSALQLLLGILMTGFLRLPTGEIRLRTHPAGRRPTTLAVFSRGTNRARTLLMATLIFFEETRPRFRRIPTFTRSTGLRDST